MLHPAAMTLAAAFIGLGGFFGFRARRQGRWARLVGATEPTEAARVREGFVKVRGNVRLGADVLTSPLTGRRCAFYRVEVFQLVGGRVKRWVRVFSGSECAAFELEDKSGRVRVDLANAEVLLAAEAGFGEDEELPQDIVQRFKERFGRTFGQGAFAPATRYAEAVLEEDEPIFVVGTAQTAPSGKKTLRRADSVCVASDQDEGPLAYQANHRRFVGLFQAGALVAMGALLLYAGWR